jgi:Flp pilus assembly pilin Flp
MVMKRKVLGQSLAEYGLILGLLSIVCIAALFSMSTEIGRIMGEVKSSLIQANVQQQASG